MHTHTHTYAHTHTHTHAHIHTFTHMHTHTHAHTHPHNAHSLVRPFGVSLLIAGFDEDTPFLFQCDPSVSSLVP